MQKCKKCSSDGLVKAGFARGLQKFKCKNCKSFQILGDKRCKYPSKIKALALFMYLENVGLRSIGKILKIRALLIQNRHFLTLIFVIVIKIFSMNKRSTLVKCLRCKSEHITKNGFNSGVQRYFCKTCSYNFTKGRVSKPLHLKRLALQLYLEGLGFRAIGRILKVSNVSVLNWIKKFGEKIEEIKSDQEIFVAEIDEMHSYIGSKKNHAGYGLLLIDLVRNSSILSSEIDLKIQEEPYIKP